MNNRPDACVGGDAREDAGIHRAAGGTV